MHRHGYKGRKFGRQTDQRSALIKGLADSLVIRESIETTLPKAKEVAIYTEKLITKAKKGGLHNRRQVISGLQTLEAAHKLFDDVAPKLKNRESGHIRVKKTELRRGDAAQMAMVSFVDDLKKAVAKEKTSTKATGKLAGSNPRASAKEKK
jgi:large subunit ribosomal protein L17